MRLSVLAKVATIGAKTMPFVLGPVAVGAKLGCTTLNMYSEDAFKRNSKKLIMFLESEFTLVDKMLS
jgi:hypothetical protein